MSGFPPQILRFVAAPNLVFSVAFFFLAMDPVRYGVYRPLILVGKAVAVFAALIAVPRLLGLDRESFRATLPVVAGFALIAVWDVCSALVLLFRGSSGTGVAGNPEVSTGPEVVEVD